MYNPSINNQGLYYHQPQSYFYGGTRNFGYSPGYYNLRSNPYSNMKFVSSIPSDHNDTKLTLTSHFVPIKASENNNPPQFRLSYLGLAPSTSFEIQHSNNNARKSLLQKNSDGKLPFYSFDNGNTRESHTDDLPPVMISPYRFKTDLPSTAPHGTYRPIDFEFSPSRPTIPHTSSPQLTPQFSTPFQPYTAPSNRKSPESHLSTSQTPDNQNSKRITHYNHTSLGARDSYFLIDFEPFDDSETNTMKSSGYYSFADPVLGTSPMVSPMVNLPDSKSFMRSGFSDNYHQINNYEYQTFYPPYNSRTFHGPAYSNLQPGNGVGFNQGKIQPIGGGTKTKYIHPSEG